MYLKLPQDGERHGERGEQHHEQRDAVEAHAVTDPEPANPRAVDDELDAAGSADRTPTRGPATSTNSTRATASATRLARAVPAPADAPGSADERDDQQRVQDPTLVPDAVEEGVPSATSAAARRINSTPDGEEEDIVRPGPFWSREPTHPRRRATRADPLTRSGPSMTLVHDPSTAPVARTTPAAGRRPRRRSRRRTTCGAESAEARFGHRLSRRHRSASPASRSSATRPGPRCRDDRRHAEQQPPRLPMRQMGFGSVTSPAAVTGSSQ